MNIKVKINESSHGDDTDEDSVVSSDDDFKPANVCSSSESGSDESDEFDLKYLEKKKKR